MRTFLTYILCLGKSWEFLAHPGLYTRRSFLVAAGAYGEPCCFSLKIYHSCPAQYTWTELGLLFLELTHLTRSKFTKYSNLKWIPFTRLEVSLPSKGWLLIFWQIVMTCHSLSYQYIIFTVRTYSWYATNSVLYCNTMRPNMLHIMYSLCSPTACSKHTKQYMYICIHVVPCLFW